MIGSDHAGASPGFDRHIADRHSLFHRQVANGVSGELKDVACSARGSDLANQIQDHVLRGHSAGQFAINAKFERLRLELQKRLRRQNVLNFAGPDAKRERTKRAVRCGVRVATNDCHARLGVTVFGADHVHDSLTHVIDVEQLNAELFAVLSQRFDLFAADRVSDWQTAIRSWNVVIGGRDGAFGTTNGEVVDPQSLERLRAGHFMDQVQINVDDRGPGLGSVNQMLVPNFVQQRSAAGGLRSGSRLAGSGRRSVRHGS